MAFTVYKHTAPNGKIYIGMTSRDVNDRWNNGRGYKKNKHFWLAIQKYTWDGINHEIIATNLSEKEACDLEIELINKYQSNNPDFGYNLDNGGKYAGKHSNSTRGKISKTLSGRKLSEENKQKISKGHIEYYKNHKSHSIGKKLTDKHKRKIGLGVKGEKNGMYGVSRFGESNPMWGKKHTKESNDKNRISQPNRRPVVQLDKNTLEIINIYDSIKQASCAVGGSDGNIGRACKEKHRVVKGYKWRYYDEHIKQKDEA